MASLRLGVLDFGDLDPVDIAPHAEALGFTRYWLAEHHGSDLYYTDPLLMSALVAGVTESIRVGPAGVLLRFHAPLAVANAARLLESAFAGRIDLGVSIGSAAPAYRDALLDGRPDSSPADLERRTRAVAAYLRDDAPLAATPRHDGAIPLWVLGGSRASAEFAGALGAAFCASLIHRPQPPDSDVLDAYRAAFRASREVPEPLCAIAVSGTSGTETATTPIAVQVTFRGSPETILELRDRYRADEVIVLELSRELEARRESLEAIAEACRP